MYSIPVNKFAMRLNLSNDVAKWKRMLQIHSSWDFISYMWDTIAYMLFFFMETNTTIHNVIKHNYIL